MDDLARFDSRGWRWQRFAIPSLVALLAIAVRLPSCSESFWLDELHSAWSVWGRFDHVAARAAAGNQAPIYFWGLWIWRLIVGDSELVLRLSSVLATAAAAVVMSAAVYRTYQSALASAVAGAVIALESDAIFYGTELRPYAVVILCSAVAVGLTMSNNQTRWHHMTAIVTVAVAAACQPTSLGVLALFVIARFAWSRGLHTASPAIGRPGLILVLFVVLIASTAWPIASVLGQAWQNRSQWQSFGAARSIMQIWQAWPWFSLIGIPFAWRLLQRRHRVDSRTIDAATKAVCPFWLPGLVAIFSVLGYWLIAYLQIAPIFHRRYFVAALPLLAWTAGAAIAPLRSVHSHELQPLGAGVLARTMMALAILLTLMFQQGTMAKLSSGKFQLIRRGEDWRGAVAWINERIDPTETVYLSAGLIESPRLLTTNDPQSIVKAQWYLTFPLSGPYRCDNVVAVDLTARASRPGVMIVRTGRQTAAELARGRTVKSFGGVHGMVAP